MENTKSKDGFWKRAGWTGMTVLPVAASLAIQILILVAFMIVISIAVGIVSGAKGIQSVDQIEQKLTEVLTDSQSLILLAYHVAALGIFGLWYYFGAGRPKPQNPGRVFSARKVLVTVLMGGFMCISGTAYLLSAEYIVPDMIREYEEMVEISGLGVDPVAIFTSIFIAPIGEEFLCRGITFHYADKVVRNMANRKAAFWIANVLQALMFAIMHANLVQGSYTFFMGLGLGWLRKRYDSLYPSMLAHFTINFSSTFLAGFLFYVIPETFAVYLAVMLIGAGIVVALATFEGRRMERLGSGQTT